ncbi:MAG: hypothetical protein IJ491_04725 [Clostridia bacterium]|nr:hypothetical protein [Clostridia bacterium]
MTDKELKKLSRLELLEILLEESKENERLRTEIEETKNEENPANVEKKLSEMTVQMNSALSQANTLIHELKQITREGITVKAVGKTSSVPEGGQVYPKVPKKENPPLDEKARNIIISDRKLYWRMMHFYAQNEMALAFLPPDIQNDVRMRLRGIINDRK